jgi:hypothetical protein
MSEIQERAKSLLLPVLISRFNVADEIADEFYLVRILVHDLQAAKSIFDPNHQFKAIQRPREHQ